MSSYPASLFSGDDFYTMSSGLAMLETTIGNSNVTLYKQFVRPTTVLEWMRNLLANRLAGSGPEWVQVYSQFNSGTYNNGECQVGGRLSSAMTSVGGLERGPSGHVPVAFLPVRVTERHRTPHFPLTALTVPLSPRLMSHHACREHRC